MIFESVFDLLVGYAHVSDAVIKRYAGGGVGALIYLIPGVLSIILDALCVFLIVAVVVGVRTMMSDGSTSAVAKRSVDNLVEHLEFLDRRAATTKSLLEQYRQAAADNDAEQNKYRAKLDEARIVLAATERAKQEKSKRH